MKKIFFIAIATIAIVILSACAIGVERWYKPGVSTYETENAQAQCEYEKSKDHVEQGDFVSNCMKRQGFRWTYVNQ